ncbi:hypothetical protein BDY17DRAFT_294692 [Neohortaea acidophila]|uniref:Secreted protein n=1 Tax=Neohortaea acidophila TaxID=245834 RepID=A0A6A6PW37_9PEZI|nr:uncharacterized protein BDY17DRAFT_294692 [Neohortaea acidophila]KAF2483951.1 hypothetical protein BDY17DRAFT_294692 [Neohortaea acidophila]
MLSCCRARLLNVFLLPSSSSDLFLSLTPSTISAAAGITIEPPIISTHQPQLYNRPSSRPFTANHRWRGTLFHPRHFRARVHSLPFADGT